MIRVHACIHDLLRDHSPSEINIDRLEEFGGNNVHFECIYIENSSALSPVLLSLHLRPSFLDNAFEIIF